MKELFKCNNIYDSLQELATSESITITDLKQCSIPTMKCYEEATQIAELGQYYGEPIRLWYYEERSQAEKDAIIANADLETKQARYNVLRDKMKERAIDEMFRSKSKRNNGHTDRHTALETDFEDDYAEYEQLITDLGL